MSALFSSASAPVTNSVTTALQRTQQHLDAVAQAHALAAALTKLSPVWSPLPVGPYPPASDTTDFPRSGTPGLIVSASSVTRNQIQEPARVAKGLASQAAARRPKLSPLFWVGIACLGAGIYLSRK